MTTHTISAWGENDQEYTVVFNYRKSSPATLEYPGDEEEVEIEQVFLDGKELNLADVKGTDLDRFTTDAWEYMNDDEDPPSDWKREYETNYER